MLAASLPAQVAFNSVSALLSMIRVCLPHPTTNISLTFIQDSMANDQDYVDLGLSCADICKALDRGSSQRRLGDLGKSVLGAIEQLTM